MMLENGKSSPRLTAPKEKEQTSSASYNIQGIFGRNLKQKRLEKGMTQEQLAAKIGTKKSYISRIENGHTDIQLSTLFKIFQGLGRKISFTIM